MNTRQKKILQVLLTNQVDYILVRDLAQQLECSEKTIRNDFKIIEEFLQNDFRTILLRKPGIGVMLQVDKDEEAQLHHLLQESDNLNVLQEELSEESMLDLAYHLLMDTTPTSKESLAQRYYITKAVLNKTLEFLTNWLQKQNLQLGSKQKIGIYLIGEERDKRTALANLDQLRSNVGSYHPFIFHYFLAYELEIVRKKLKQFQDGYILFFTDESFENVIVHILLMTKRTKMKQSVILSNEEVEYLKQKQEYQWVDKLGKELSSIFHVQYPDDELAYLTMHILGAKIYHQKEDPQFFDLEMEQRANKISDQLTKRLTILSLVPFVQDEILMEGLRIHLYTTLNRLKFELHVNNPLVQDIKKMYPYMFDMLVFVLGEMKDLLECDIPENEIAYLTLHYQASIERINRKKVKTKRVVIVCHMGIGVSEILRTKIEGKFPNIDVIGAISRRELSLFIKENQVDLIVTTTPIDIQQPNHVVVSPLLDNTDEKKLNKLLQSTRSNDIDSKPSPLGSFVNSEYVFLQVDIKHRVQLIEQLADRLYVDGIVEKDYARKAVIREETSATAIGGGIAIPHGDPNLVKQSTIAVATLKEPLDWAGEKVSIVFLLAVKNDAALNRRELFQRLTVLAEQPTLVQKLIKETDKENFLLDL